MTFTPFQLWAAGFVAAFSPTGSVTAGSQSGFRAMADTPTAQCRLDSWKDIAAYLKRDVRTAIRWEQERGLPVHRVPGGRRKAVFAYAHELDAWLVREETGYAESPRPSAPVLRSSSPFGSAALGLNTREFPSASHSSPMSALDDWEQLTPRKVGPLLPFPAQAAATPSNDLHPGGSAVRTADRLPFSTRSWFKLALAGAMGVAAMALWVAAARMSAPHSLVRITGETQLTNDGLTKAGPVRTDGARVYFTVITNGLHSVAEAPATGGQTHLLPTTLADVLLLDVSPDGSELLVGSPTPNDLAEPHLYSISAAGGTPRPLGMVTAHGALWAPDGKSVFFCHAAEVWTMKTDGTDVQRLLATDGWPTLFAWSPDKTKLMFTIAQPGRDLDTIWEMDVHGNARHLGPTADLQQIGGLGWLSADSVLVSAHPAGERRGKLLAFMTEPSFFGRQHQEFTEPVTDLLDIDSFVVSRDGLHLYSYAPSEANGELLRWDEKSRQFHLFLPNLSPTFVAWSPDGRRVSYVKTDSTLWKAAANGSAPQQLVFAPMQTMLPQWSPDGKMIAFTARLPGKQWRVYLVPSDGGPPQRLTTTESVSSEGATTWSSDGRAIIFGEIGCRLPGNCAIHRVDLKTRTATILPGSEGLRTARWSPNGRSVVALRENTREMLLFDFATRKWTSLAQPVTGDDLAWSKSGEYVYGYSRYSTDPDVFRVHIRSHRKERVASLTGVELAGGSLGNWMGLDPQDVPLFYHNVPAQEIYAFNLDAR